MLFAGSIVSNIQNTWRLEALNFLCCSHVYWLDRCQLILVYAYNGACTWTDMVK